MRLLRQDVNTFKGLGDSEFNSPENHKYNVKRLDNTIDFVNRYYRPSSILDVAGPSILGEKMASYYNAEYYHTDGNIDRIWTANKQEYDLVVMMEVLEHILNPLKFFDELREYDFEYMLVTWPARPSWLWTFIHFHEMRLDRFEYLCKLSGYEILKVEKNKIPESWYNRFRGIRPFCRSFINTHYLALIKKA